MNSTALIPSSARDLHTASSQTNQVVASATSLDASSTIIRQLAEDLLAATNASWSAGFIADGNTLLPFFKLGAPEDLEAAEWAGTHPMRGEFVIEVVVGKDNPGASYLPHALGLVWVRSKLAGMVALGPPKSRRRYSTDDLELIADAARRAGRLLANGRKVDQAVPIPK